MRSYYLILAYLAIARALPQAVQPDAADPSPSVAPPAVSGEADVPAADAPTVDVPIADNATVADAGDNEADTPVDAADDTPADTGDDTPDDQATEGAADDTPADAADDTPADAADDTPADTGDDTPVDTGDDTPDDQATDGADDSPAASPTASAECSFCTIPAGYTSEEWPAPLNVDDQFSPRFVEAHAKAKEALKNWSVQDKVDLATGVGWMQGACVGNTKALPDQNWKGLCLEDSPVGVRFADFVSVFPAGINAASTFDKDLIYQRGAAMGSEFRGKGVNVALGPMTNLGRVAAGGRNWEGFGGDPYLAGHATEQTIKGLQDQGVQASVKHYIGNEQERNRTTSSSNLDDRTLRELYLHPFVRAVLADTASVMSSYNLVNGSWASQNSKTLNGILKTDLGYGGFVLSDWDGTHSGVLAANNGLDMDMPGDINLNGGLTSYFGGNLTAAVNNGTVSTERLDDMVQRIMASYYLVGQDQDYPDVNFDAWEDNNEHVDVQGDHYKLIRHIGASSTVLLKNVNNALPLNKPRSIAVIGSDMGPAVHGPNGCTDMGCSDGHLAVGWGSGTAYFPYLVDPLQAISSRAQQDRSALNWHLDDWDLEGAKNAARPPEVAIVGVSSNSGEQYITVDGNVGDRNNLSAWNNGDELILAVASTNKNTVVVVHSVGPMDMEQWIDHENITAVLWAGIQGQESGNALVDILYGDYNPSGRLPYTIAHKREDYPADIEYVTEAEPVETDVNYTEGLLIDYRHFQANGISPRFAFGYGGSYTSFEYSNLQVTSENAKRGEDKGDKHGDHDGQDGHDDHDGHGDGHGDGDGVKIGRLVTDDLHRARWSISADVKNVGDINGCDVPQLYLLYPEGSGEPPRVLRDFARVNIDPGVTTTVSFKLSKYDVSIWDVVKQDYVVPEGEFVVTIARDSFDDAGAWGSFTPSV